VLQDCGAAFLLVAWTLTPYDACRSTVAKLE
jgi:hypothetical protein